MAEPARPYTTKQLAQRWQCAEQHIRHLIRDGELTAFRLGRLIRISQAEVDRFERGEVCGSSGTAAPGAPTGATNADARFVDLSERRIARRRSDDSATSKPSPAGPGR